MAAMKMQVDIFLLFGLFITRKDKVLPTRPIGTNVGSQYVPLNEAILKVKNV